jgi:two-component system, cell cycle response regulator
LIIVKNSDQESEVFKFLKAGDDTCRADSHVSVIAGKISRILKEHQIRSLQSEKLNLLNDPLTGLLSRAAIHREMEFCADSEIPLSSQCWAIIFIDIDFFKQINDCYGHHKGDEVIRKIAELLKTETKPEDKLARPGGEEFIILMSRYNKQTILDSCERIRQTIAAHKFGITQGKDEYKVTASFGVKFLELPIKIDESLQQADMALYQAKNNGRNNVVCYDSMQESDTNVEQDLHLQHFENVTRVVNERVTNLITLMGRRMIEAARQEANNDALAYSGPS